VELEKLIPLVERLVAKTQEQVSRAMAAPIDEAIQYAKAQDRSNADETGWRLNESSRAEFQLAMQLVRRRILALLEEGTGLSCTRVPGMCKQILKRSVSHRQRRAGAAPGRRVRVDRVGHTRRTALRSGAL
jgi:hypothetical protein